MSDSKLVKAAERRIAEAENPTNLARWSRSLVRPIVIPRSKLIKTMPYPREEKPVAAAFNNSIINWEGKRYMSFRVEAQPFFHAARIAVCELDENNEPVSDSVLLDLKTQFNGARAEDPRWFVFNGKLCLSYNDNKRQFWAEMETPFKVAQCWQMRANFKLGEVEKNWQFFGVRDSLYALYDSGENFRVLTVNGDVGRLAHSHKWAAHAWEYGIIRGGASPVFHNNRWYHWFHSSVGIDMARHGVVRRYFAGVMTFEADPPFRPLALSTEPILRGCTERSGEPISSLNPAVFPCGAIRDPNGWLVSYGINNLNCGVAFVSDLLVEKLLRPAKILP